MLLFYVKITDLCLDIKEKNNQTKNKKGREAPNILMVYYFLPHLFQESK